VMGNYHAGFGREGACFLPDFIGRGGALLPQLHVRPVQQPPDGREAVHARPGQDEEGPRADLPGSCSVEPDGR
jgi:hypothetical protein